MATPNLVPRVDDEGSIGTASKRWSEAYFAGRVRSRDQNVGLKYFVSDEPTRFNMSGMSAATRPEDGDVVFQYYPPTLFLVVDDTQLGNSSGYYEIPSIEDLANKMDTYNGTGYSPSLLYSGVQVLPSGSGLAIIFQGSGQSVLSIIDSGVQFNGFVYLDNVTTGQVLVTDDQKYVTSIGVTTGELASLVGVTSNIQDQLDVLATGIVTSPGGSNFSIQYKNGSLFAGSADFRYNSSGGFGLNSGTLRGPFDVMRRFSGVVTATGTVTLAATGGSTFTDETLLYRVYPYTELSGQTYYSFSYITHSITGISGTYDVEVSWPPQSGAYGYRIVGVSGSSTVYETTGTSFVDSGVSNATGAMIPNTWGANLYLDYLSNLFLSGLMYINGYRVLTTFDVASGNTGEAVVFYDDTYVVKTTGNQRVSGEKTFLEPVFVSSGLGIATSYLRGPLDVGYGTGIVNPPTNLNIAAVYDYAYQLWDTSGELTFEVYAYSISGASRTYSSGISGSLPLSGSYNWFKVDLSWTGVAEASGYRIIFGGDETNARYRDYYIETTGTSLSYGTTGDVLTYQSPIVVGPTEPTEYDFYVNFSGDLHTRKDIYCRYIFADNLGSTIPSGGNSGQFLKRAETGGTGVVWGNTLEPYTPSTSGSSLEIDFLSGQLQSISVSGDITVSTANKEITRFASVKLFSTTGTSFSFESGWVWLGADYSTGIVLQSGKNGILSLTCYGTGAANVVSIFRYEDDVPTVVTPSETGSFATTGWVDDYYYPRSNPSGYLTEVGATIPTGGYSGQPLKRESTGSTGVIFGEILNAHTTGAVSSVLTVDFLSGQLQSASISGSVYVATANRSLSRFASIKFTSTTGCSLSFATGWTWLGQDYSTGAQIPSGVDGVLSLTCYGSSENSIVSILRYENDIPVSVQTGDTGAFATTGWVDENYYPRSNPSGYLTSADTGGFVGDGETGSFATTGWTDQYYYPRSNPSGYLTGINTGILVGKDETGIFVTTGDTGSFATTGWTDSNYYPRSNPSGYLSGLLKTVLLCAGFTPTATGADVAEVPIPFDSDGTTPIVWNVSRLNLRVQTSGGAPSVSFEKYSGSGQFSGFTLGLVTLETGAFEGYTTGITGTLASNDKVRFNVGDLGTAQNWTVSMEIFN